MISFENGKAKVNCNPLKPCERLVFISQPMRGLTEEQINAINAISTTNNSEK